jgi:hypothetical protein
MTSDYIQEMHIDILHLNKNFFHQHEENSTVDITNIANINSSKSKKNINQRQDIKKKIFENEKLEYSFDESTKPKNLISKENQRLDAFGNPINKKKKQKVTFIDVIDRQKPLISITPIESYKQYNLLTNFHVNEDLFKEKSNCTCCCYII